ncbi:DUF2382 domain-containing protein [Arthrobacter sp. H14]|uniref:DUF2382 domain-containing protein n=1 Tax=Arthrobacter sp. H14 TaxID=1312959 RepID=UPI000478FA16|nr:PRC and DUF2382 domain-containing protein [Arthrobacter sp. H14]
MVSMQQLQSLMENNGTVVDQDGGKIGKIGQVYLDDRTNEPEWVSASTGLFGSSESFVPLQGAAIMGDQLAVKFSKDMVKDAPRVEADGNLSPSQEDELHSFYKVGYADTGGTGGEYRPDGVTGNRDADGVTGAPQGAGHDTSGPNTDDAMTRSEEVVHVGKEQQETGKARLRKYVVTENVQTTVPVSHEEVRVEREPITDQNRDEATSGPSFNEEEHEVTLHAEKPVVDKEEKPVERVRLEKEEVQDEAEINEQVRKERIESEGDMKGR